MPRHPPSDQVNIASRADEDLRRALKTPPKHHKDMKER